MFIITFFFTYLKSLYYLDRGFTDNTFREVCLNAMKVWKNFANGGKRSCQILLSQLRKYSKYRPPYDMEYADDYDTPEMWWSTCRQPDNFIQELALKLFAITPHQASCERVFSVLNWMTGKRRTRYLLYFMNKNVY